MNIRRYCKDEETLLFDLIIEEGAEWSDYHSLEGRDKYIKAIESSIVYIALENEMICGYIRCREDDGFGVYIYDLLVRKSFRGQDLGKLIIDKLCQDYPNQPIYVMSDIDPYYEKLGYQKEGSIFRVKL